jgi:Domain of unknown function (DUF1772)
MGQRTRRGRGVLILIRVRKTPTQANWEGQKFTRCPKPSLSHSERALAVRNLFFRVSPHSSEATKMRSAFEFLALCSCGLFAGAALYVSLVEHPARMSCGVVAAITEFRPSYKRATVMQVSLAAISFASGITAWLAGAGSNWLIGALLIGAVIPFTLIFIWPTNRRLLDPALNPTSDSALKLLRNWGQLHAVRAVLSFSAFVVFLSTFT